MRQFRTSTDSVFDIDDDEGHRDVSVVTQPGPPAAESHQADPAPAPGDA